jgi:hypothetical protein
VWPWRRTRQPAAPAPRQPAAEPAAPAPRQPATEPAVPALWSRGEWQTLRPIQRVLPDHPLINPVQRFTATLTSWSDPSYLEPLGHRIGPAEPSGVVAGLASPVPATPVRVTPVQRAEPAPDLPVAQPPRPQAGGFWSRLLAAAVQRTAEPSGAPMRREAGAGHQVEQQPGLAEQGGGDVGQSHVDVFERRGDGIAATITDPPPSSHGETGSASQAPPADLSQPAPGDPGSVTISKSLDAFAAPAVSVPVVRPLQRTAELVTAKPVDLPIPRLPAIPAAEVPPLASTPAPTILSPAKSPAETPAKSPAETPAETPSEPQVEAPRESLAEAANESPADPGVAPVPGLDSPDNPGEGVEESALFAGGLLPVIGQDSSVAAPLAAPPPAAASSVATPQAGAPVVQRAGSPSPATSRRLGLGAPIVPAEVRSGSPASHPEAPFVQRSPAVGAPLGDQGPLSDVGSPGGSETASALDATISGPAPAGPGAASAFGAAVPTLQTSTGETTIFGGTSVNWQSDPNPDPAGAGDTVAPLPSGPTSNGDDTVGGRVTGGDDTVAPLLSGHTSTGTFSDSSLDGQLEEGSTAIPDGQPDYGQVTTLGTTSGGQSAHGGHASPPSTATGSSTHGQNPPSSTASPALQRHQDSAATPAGQPDHGLATTLGGPTAPSHGLTDALATTVTAGLPDHDFAVASGGTAPGGLSGHGSATPYSASAPGRAPGHGSAAPYGGTAPGEQPDPDLTLIGNTAAGPTYVQTATLDATATARDTAAGGQASHGLAATLGSVAAAGPAGPGSITVARIAASPMGSPTGLPATATAAGQGRLLPSPPDANGGGQPLAVSYGQTASHDLVRAPLAIQRTGPVAIQRTGSYGTPASPYGSPARPVSPNGTAAISMPLGIARPAVQRQETGTATPAPAEPPPEPPPSESAAPELAAAQNTDPNTTPEAQAGGQAVQPAQPAAASPADADELVKKLFDPLLHRLKAELRLDRERRGKLTDLRH